MPEKTRRVARRITARDVPRLLETLNGCDDEAKDAVLRDLCPCRNRRYDREVWAAIYDAYEQGETRHQAAHAIGTLQGVRFKIRAVLGRHWRWVVQAYVEPVSINTIAGGSRMSRKSTPERDALIAGLLEEMRRQLQEQLPDEQATLDQIEEAAGKIARQISQDVQRRLVAQRGTKQPQLPATKCTCGAAVRYKGQQVRSIVTVHGVLT